VRRYESGYVPCDDHERDEVGILVGLLVGHCFQPPENEIWSRMALNIHQY
jgi:hypothetical protein